MLYLLIIFAIILTIGLIFSVVFCFYRILASIKGAPYAGSSLDIIGKMIDISGITIGNKVVDLGSGDGRILIELRKRYSNIKSVGYEIDPFLAWYAKYKIRKLGYEKFIKIENENYWHKDLSKFDVIFLFLIPYQMSRMERKLRAEVKKGAKVISYGYQFKKWKFQEKFENIYLYQK